MTLILFTLAIAIGCGFNLYGTAFFVGILFYNNVIQAPSELEFLQNNSFLFVTGFLYLIQFTADKIKGADNSWDVFNTYIRLPYGALMVFLSLKSEFNIHTIPVFFVAVALIFASNMAKSIIRLMANTSGKNDRISIFKNWQLSLIEDIFIVTMILFALKNAILFWIFLIFYIFILVYTLQNNYIIFSNLHSFIYKIFTKSKKERV